MLGYTATRQMLVRNSHSWPFSSTADALHHQTARSNVAADAVVPFHQPYSSMNHIVHSLIAHSLPKPPAFSRRSAMVSPILDFVLSLSSL